MNAKGLLPEDTKVRSPKYLNNLIEHDHRAIKQRTAPMLGFKLFQAAVITIAGLELLHRIHKDQFALAHLGAQGRAASTVWLVPRTSS